MDFPFLLLISCSKLVSVPKRIVLFWARVFKLAPKQNNNQSVVPIFIAFYVFVMNVWIALTKALF
jgi:hypothetical protein